MKHFPKFQVGLALLLFALTLSIGLRAQVSSSTVSGSVTDSTGAIIPNIKVVATQTQTGVKTVAVSNSAGQYNLPFLPPGPYNITVEAPGFKAYSQKNLTLAVGDHPTVDIALEVGEATQRVEVTAISAQLGTADASLGQVVTTKQVESLPLNGRTPMVLAQYTAGVVSTTTPGQVRAFDNSGISAFSVGGLPNKNSEILMDGAPDNASDNAIAYSPPVDAVSEIRIHVFESDAAYGHSGGGVANQITKNGTNRLHGSLFEFNQVSALASNSYFNKRTNTRKGVSRYNQYGGSVGGPVFIPKVFDGRDKLFFFFAYEGIKDSGPNNNFTSVPTVAERNGDFSALLAEGPQYQMYDPYTGVTKFDAKGNAYVQRSPYPNNVIPKSEFSAVGQAILNFYPQPNLTTGQPDGTNDYFTLANNGDKYSTEFARADYNVSERNKLFFTYRHNNRLQYVNQLLGNSNPALGDFLSRINDGGTVADVYTLSPSLVGETRLNFTRYVQNQTATGAGFDATTLGFPSYIASNSTAKIFPRINMSGILSLGVPTTSYSLAPYNSYGIYSDLIKIVGSHSLKVGVDARQFQKGQLTFGNSQGQFNFDNTYLKSTSTSIASTVTGNDVASLLLGLPSGGSYDINAKSVAYQNYLGVFVQDDWRARPDLTLNFGLRFEREFPAYERQGRVVNGFASTTPSPIAAAAIAAYAKSPIPQLSAAAFQVNGGLTFASPSNRNIYQQQSHLFSPRFGFAYTPKELGGKTSIRGGFGFFVIPNFPFNNQVNQEGFSQTTSLQASLNGFLTPNATLSNPFPQGIVQPAGSSGGLSTFLGQNITYFSPIVKNGYSERWNLGIQHQFPGNTLLEVVYIGNHAVKLPISYFPNYIPAQYLTTASQPGLNTQVANPFKGLMPNGSFNGSQITQAQLLTVYPQFGSITVQNAPLGSSYYNAFDVRAEKRAGHGVTLIANYQWSKLLERVSYLNTFDPSPELRISTYDHPTHLVAAVTYELPYGRGRQFGAKAPRYLDLPLGGWIINGVYTFQTGAPLTFGNVLPKGQPVNLNPRQTTPKVSALNTAAFDTSSAQPIFNIRTFPSQFSNLRFDAINNFDASVLKNFNLTESAYFQFRAEAFNVNNRPQFSGPNLSPTSSTFGIINVTANGPRVVQFGGRIVF